MTKHEDPTLELIADAFRGASSSDGGDAERIIMACKQMFGHPAFRRELKAYSPHDRQLIRTVFAEKLYFNRERLREVAREGASNLFSYCLRCLRNCAIDVIRSSHSEFMRLSSVAPEVLAAISQAAPPEDGELVPCVVRAIQGMPEPNRTVLMLSLLQDESNKAIGSRIGKTPGNVGVILHRSLKELRRLLSRLEP
ncbi:MAG: RNA polymerase sigma factor [Planctomycetota bacterium]